MRFVSVFLLLSVMCGSSAHAGGGGNECFGRVSAFDQLRYLANATITVDKTGFRLRCPDIYESTDTYRREGHTYVRSVLKCVASTGETVTIDSLETEDESECRENVETLVTTNRQTCEVNSVAGVMDRLFKRHDPTAECVTRGTRTACFRKPWTGTEGTFYVFDRLGDEVGCATEVTMIPGEPKDLDSKVFGGAGR